MKDEFGERYALGTPMLEVFSVTITKNVETESCSQIYGSIHVTDARGTNIPLYDRRPDSESAYTDGTLQLTGPPTKGISALTNFTIHLDLTDAAHNFEINRSISWNPKHTFYYDKRLSINVLGNNASATLNCAIYSVAKSAQVEIVLSGKDGMEGDIEIYGTLVASCGNMFAYSTTDDTLNFQTLLFNHSPGNCLNLKLGEPIPLLRSVLAFPAYSSLVVAGELYLRGTSEPILRGSTPEMLPTTYLETQVVGERLVAQVNVGWGCTIEDKDFC